eukprot:846885-Pyramimonas_sp.AAC.1
MERANLPVATLPRFRASGVRELGQVTQGNSLRLLTNVIWCAGHSSNDPTGTLFLPRWARRAALSQVHLLRVFHHGAARTRIRLCRVPFGGLTFFRSLL